jgi:hypothetical protein
MPISRAVSSTCCNPVACHKAVSCPAWSKRRAFPHAPLQRDPIGWHPPRRLRSFPDPRDPRCTRRLFHPGVGHAMHLACRLLGVGEEHEYE